MKRDLKENVYVVDEVYDVALGSEELKPVTARKVIMETFSFLFQGSFHSETGTQNPHRDSRPSRQPE